MNSVIMTTYLAGAIMGQASFGSMDKCKTAAQEVMTQETNGLSVVCTYQQDAKIARKADIDAKFDAIFNKFLNMVRELQDLDRKNELEVERNDSSWSSIIGDEQSNGPWSSITGDEKDESNWTIIENHVHEFTTSFSKCDSDFEAKLAVEPNKWITENAKTSCKDF